MEVDPQETRVFLSYARNDKELAHVLSRELKNHGVMVWDDQSIEPGDRWLEEIKKALERCNSMIALLNEHSFSSSYVRDELEHAFFDERYKHRLLPVLIGGTSESAFSRLPWVLTKLATLRITDRESPEEMAKRITKVFLEKIEEESGVAR